MNRNYPTKFGQYYSTSAESEPRFPWLTLAGLVSMLVLAAIVG